MFVLFVTNVQVLKIFYEIYYLLSNVPGNPLRIGWLHKNTVWVERGGGTLRVHMYVLCFHKFAVIFYRLLFGGGGEEGSQFIKDICVNNNLFMDNQLPFETLF